MAKAKEIVRCARCNKAVAGNKHVTINGIVLNHECVEKAKKFVASEGLVQIDATTIDAIRQDYKRIMRETTVLGMHRRAGKDAVMFGTQWMIDNGYSHLLES